MPMLLDISNELTERFLKAKSKGHSANEIIIEINSLHYADSKKPIEYEVKVAIINVIESNLSQSPKDSVAFSKKKRHILAKLNTMNEKGKVSINLIDSFDMLRHHIEKYLLR